MNPLLDIPDLKPDPSCNPEYTVRTNQPALVMHRSLQTHLRDAVVGG